MAGPLLEVIALGPEDAVAACAGGADRLEVVADMHADGLTPARETFARIRAAVDVPLRVMLRAAEGFGVGDPYVVCASAVALCAEGADEFVLGFLDRHGHPDLVATEMVVGEIEGCAWTFHRAIDHSADRHETRRLVAELPGLDAYLTAGSPQGVGDGLAVLLDDAARTVAGEPGYEPRIVAGGGLRLEHLPALRAGGIDAFHIGGAARPGGWSGPVDATAVRRWRESLDAPAEAR